MVKFTFSFTEFVAKYRLYFGFADNILPFCASVTKEILRTNVIVSEIVLLEIETTTRLLYLEDSPEELIARGFDSEGKLE